MTTEMEEVDDVQFNEPSEADLAALATFMPSFSFDEEAIELNTEETTAPPEVSAEPAAEEEEFEFKLFSTGTTERVTIHEPEQESYEVPVRPMSYYFHTASPETLAQIAHSAIDADEIMRWSRVPCTWNARPHRVTVVKSQEDKETDEKKKQKRWRPSKARRDKFKVLKKAEAERDARRAALRAQTFRSGMRGGGRGRGRGGASTAPARTPTSNKAPATGKPATGGYPRKGAPPV